MASTPKLLLVDPLTLLGRELLGMLADHPRLCTDLKYLHTDENEEYQIAEIGGQPALVPPLKSLDDLEGVDVIVVASDRDRSALSRVEEHLDRSPTMVFVEMGRLARFRSRTRPVAAAVPDADPPHFRVAHPALVAAAKIVEPIAHMSVKTLSVAAVEPVSVFGREGVESLARQAVNRLRGETVEDRVDGEVLAFTQLARAGDLLTADLAAVLPHLDASASLTLTGSFHGHVAHIALVFAEPVEEGELLQAWSESAQLRIVDLPLRLDSVVESDMVNVTAPQLSPGRTALTVTAMVDGLRVGGASSAVEILEAMV